MSSLLRKATSSTFFLSSSGIVTKLISFFSVIIITRVLSLVEYGTITLALSVTGPVAFLSSIGLDSLITADISKARGEGNHPYIKRLLWSFVSTKLMLAFVIITLAWIFKPFVIEKFGNSAEKYFILLSVWAIIQTINSIFELILTAHEEFKTISYSRVIESATKLAAIIFFWQLQGLDAPIVVAAYIIAKIFTTIFNGYSLRKVLYYLKTIIAIKTRVLLNILKRHGKWEIVTNAFISQFVEDGLRPWIIRSFIGLSGLGVISLAGSLYATLYELLPIKKVIFPLLARLSDEKDSAIILSQKISKYTFFIYAVVAITAFFLVVPVINIVFPKYADAIMPFRILLVQFVINGASVAQPSFLYTFKLQKSLAYYSLINIFSIFTLLPLSLKIFGINGSIVEKTIILFTQSWLRERLLEKVATVRTWRWKNLIIFDAYDKYVMHMIKRVFVLKL